MDGDIPSELLIVEEQKPNAQQIFEHSVINEKIIGTLRRNNYA